MTRISLSVIRRMKPSNRPVRDIKTFVKVITAIQHAGVELLDENIPRAGLESGVRIRIDIPNSCRRRVWAVHFKGVARSVGSNDVAYLQAAAFAARRASFRMSGHA